MYCYNCMKNFPDSDSCPLCKDAKKAVNAPHHIAPGTVIGGKYTVGNPLGEGGFGITYAGLDNTLEVKVAIKEFFPSGYVNRNNTFSNEVTVTTQKQKDFFEGGKEKFLQEARSVARFLDEDGIVSVRDFFEDNNTAYIVMEYLDGLNLNDYTKKNGIFSAEEIFTLMLPIMDSLERVHEGGIIHRDISPENIMFLKKKKNLKLMDFGAARHYQNQEKALSVMLKQGYAPEEQYRKNGIQGPYTDVYGLCATIYKCITGKIPDDGLDRLYEDTLKKPSELSANISPALETVLMYGLAVHAKDRCQDMHELKELVIKALRNEPIEIRTDAKVCKEPAPAPDINRTMIADEDDFVPPARVAPAPAPVNAPNPQESGPKRVSSPAPVVSVPQSNAPAPVAAPPAHSAVKPTPLRDIPAIKKAEPLPEDKKSEGSTKKGKNAAYLIVGIIASVLALAGIDMILKEILGFGLF